MGLLHAREGGGGGAKNGFKKKKFNLPLRNLVKKKRFLFLNSNWFWGLPGRWGGGGQRWF